MEFEPGDLVSLKSGGTLMTVEQVGDLAMGGGEARDLLAGRPRTIV